MIKIIREEQFINVFKIIIDQVLQFDSQKQTFLKKTSKNDLTKKYYSTTFLFQTINKITKPYLNSGNKQGVLDKIIDSEYINFFVIDVLLSYLKTKGKEKDWDNENINICIDNDVDNNNNNDNNNDSDNDKNNDIDNDSSFEISGMISTTERLKYEKCPLIFDIEFYKLKHTKDSGESKKRLKKMFDKNNSSLIFPENGGASSIVNKDPDYFTEISFINSRWTEKRVSSRKIYKDESIIRKSSSIKTINI